MKPEETKQGFELNEEELDGVTGGSAILGQSVNAMNAALKRNSTNAASVAPNILGASAVQGQTLQTNALNPTNRENINKM